MSEETGRLFRGRELPLLFVLVAIMAAGWTYVVWKVLAPPEPTARKPPTVAELPPLPPPDDSIELQGVQDKEPLTAHETLAYAKLARKARETPAARLAAESRRDVAISQLITHPGRYRGLPIHLEGVARRILVQDADGKKVFPKGRYYEASLFTQESHPFSYTLVFENAPPDLQVGPDVWENLAFDGYFLKLWPYVAGDKPRFAPLLVGRLAPRTTAPVSRGQGRLPIDGTVLVLAALTVYIGIRLAVKFRSVPRSFPPPRLPAESIDVTAWLEQGEEGKPFVPRDEV